MARSRILVLCLAAGLALATSACRQEVQPEQAADVTEQATAPAVEPTVEGGRASQLPLDTYVGATIGEPESLDPAWTYETTGSTYQASIYDSLIFFEREKPDAYVPGLATEYQISEDQLTYTFSIREGVTFHEGGTLEPHDIAYSLQRAMLQDRADGPMALFLEPILGTSSIESLALETAGMADDEDATLETVPADVKTQMCELVKAAVTADDEARTATITLRQPTPWFRQLLSQPWAVALDQEWMAEQGDWDGDCATWPEYHNPEAQESILFDRANGTGPYKLGSWKKGEEITLVANEAYWRTEPIWPGGPSGPARIKTVVLRTVPEWSGRLAMLRGGEADHVVVDRAQIAQLESMIHTVYEGRDESAPSTAVNPDGTLKLFKGYQTAQSTVQLFSFAIDPESEFIGTGQLDGQGIPPDFFSDINVRRGFNYCFDWDTYIQEGLQGEGIQLRGPIIEGLQGWRADSDVYSFDLDKCRAELEQAWGGQLTDVGFELTLVYNQGNDTRKMAAEILSQNLAEANQKFVARVQQLEWPAFLAARREQKLPITIVGWLADYHDASNWVHPFMHSQGAYGRAQHFPADLQAQFDELIEKAAVDTDPASRDQTYAQLQQLAYDNAIDIFLEQATGRQYFNRQLTGYYQNPLAPGFYYYAFAKQ